MQPRVPENRHPRAHSYVRGEYDGTSEMLRRDCVPRTIPIYGKRPHLSIIFGKKLPYFLRIDGRDTRPVSWYNSHPNSRLFCPDFGRMVAYLTQIVPGDGTGVPFLRSGGAGASGRPRRP